MFPDAEMCVTSNTFPSNVRFASALNASVPVAVNTLLSTPLDIKSDTSTLNCPLDKSKPVPAVKLPDISSAICAELLTKVLDNSVSAVVIRVEKLPLSVCKLLMSVSFVVTLELNEPLSVCKLSTFVSSVVILVEKLPLSVCKLSTFVSSVVILVEKLPLSVCRFVMLVSSVVNLVDNEPLKLVKEPDISEEICAELLIKVFPNSLSVAVILVEKLLLAFVKEPDMSDAI